MNKQLRTVKRRKTANRLLKTTNCTIFEVTTYGYRMDGKTVSNNIIQNREFQVFQGKFYNYQLPLRENQKAIILKENEIENLI